MDLYFLQKHGTDDYFVIAAINYEEARKKATKASNSEVWMDRNLTSCKRLTTEEDIRPLEITIESLK